MRIYGGCASTVDAMRLAPSDLSASSAETLYCVAIFFFYPSGER